MGYTEDMLYPGASGFSCDDRVGTFYSLDMPRREWLPKIRELDNVAESTFSFANNHWRGQSVGAIHQLRVILD